MIEITCKKNKKKNIWRIKANEKNRQRIGFSRKNREVSQHALESGEKKKEMGEVEVKKSNVKRTGRKEKQLLVCYRDSCS